MNPHEENILTFLNKKTEPVDVEKIRVSCKIGNWNTALKHCLDLTIQEKIHGQKTSKGWVFWSRQNVQLKPWEEAIGTLDKIENNETETVAFLTCTSEKQIAIILPKDQQENQKLPKLIGKKIALLRTDNPQKPFSIRTINATPDAKKSESTLPWLRRSILVGPTKRVFNLASTSRGVFSVW